MDKEIYNFSIILFIKVSFKTVRNKAMALFSTQINLNTKANLLTDKEMAPVR